jgi:hypothetical protein
MGWWVEIYLFSTSPEVISGCGSGGCLKYVSGVSNQGKHLKKRTGLLPLFALRNSTKKFPQGINERCSAYKIHVMELTNLAFI